MLSLFEMVTCGSDGDWRARNETTNARVASTMAAKRFRGYD